jgi:hypothetical protein
MKKLIPLCFALVLASAANATTYTGSNTDNNMSRTGAGTNSNMPNSNTGVGSNSNMPGNTKVNPSKETYDNIKKYDQDNSPNTTKPGSNPNTSNYNMLER